MKSRLQSSLENALTELTRAHISIQPEAKNPTVKPLLDKISGKIEAYSNVLSAIESKNFVSLDIDGIKRL